VKSRALGAQDSLSGGGRYDLLVEELGGDPTPAVGFAAGMERILLALEQSGVEIPDVGGVDLFIVAREDVERSEAMRLAKWFRDHHVSVDLDYLERSQKAQMKEANRQRARYALLVFADDIPKQQFQFRDLESSDQQQLSREEILQRIKNGSK
jgi:histidyl-tRNA synthetase